MFLRIKNHKIGNKLIPYLYLCKSIWNSKKQFPEQKVIKYLGKSNLEDIDLKYIKFDKCVNCNTDKNLTIDHKISLSHGGTNALNNLQILCIRCNQKKGVS